MVVRYFRARYFHARYWTGIGGGTGGAIVGAIYDWLVTARRRHGR